MAEYFDVLTSIINKKKIIDEDVNTHFTGFQAVKWLSVNPMACYTANQINSCRGIKFVPSIAEYKFLKETIKLAKNTRLSFDKSEKDINIIMKALVKYFKTNANTTKEYIKVLGNKRISEILEEIAQTSNKYCTDKEVLALRSAISKKKHFINKLGS